MPLTNEQYNKIAQEYEDIRRERDFLIRDRKREVAARIPKFRKLEDEVISLSIDTLRQNLEGGKVPAAGSLHQKISRLHSRKLKLLSSYGYPEDFFDPPYECPDCKDTGKIGNNPCHCYLQKVINLLYGDTPMMKSLATQSFDDFVLSYYRKDEYDDRMGISSYDSALQALTLAKDFVADFPKPKSNLVIYGTTGTGKTFLSGCIAKALLDNGHTVIYLTSKRFFEICAEHSFGGRVKTPQKDYQNIFDTELLIIDDLGTELSNSFTQSALFDCINARLLAGSPTVISTNLTMQEILDVYTERVFSRLSDSYVWLHLFGTDIRLLKGLENTNTRPRPTAVPEEEEI